jgi:hypothetical protein
LFDRKPQLTGSQLSLVASLPSCFSGDADDVKVVQIAARAPVDVVIDCMAEAFAQFGSQTIVEFVAADCTLEFKKGFRSTT